MKKVLVLLGTAILLIACAGCGDNSAPKIEESDSGHVVAEVKRPPTETVEWDVTSVRLEDFGMEATRDDPKFEEVFNHTQTVPLDQLIAFDLAADALGEGSSDEIYRRFMEAPNTVLNYLALMGTQTVEWGLDDEVCAAEMVCRGIASADVCWHGATHEFDQIVASYKAYYPDGRIAELLSIMEEEHLAALERQKEDQAAWENLQNEKEPAVSSNPGSEEQPQKPIQPSSQEHASQNPLSTGKSDVPEAPAESENTEAASSGVEAWLEAKQAAQFQNQRLPVGPAQLTGEELKSWLSDPSSYDGYFVPTNYVEDGNGNTA